MSHPSWIGWGSFVAALCLASTGCTTESESAGDTSAPATTAASPFAWMDEECHRAGAASAEDVLCPTWLPLHLAPTDNVFTPTRDGYMFEADGAEHWVFGAYRDQWWERRYGKLERVRSVAVRGRQGELLAAPDSAGIFALHVLLAWSEGPFRYVASVHAPVEQAIPAQRDLIRVAERMARY